jgi:hypothetical protein
MALRDLPRQFIEAFGYSRKALELVWQTSHRLTVWLGLLTVMVGTLPAAVVSIGALIVDAVVAASSQGGNLVPVLQLVALEGLAVRHRDRWPPLDPEGHHHRAGILAAHSRTDAAADRAVRARRYRQPAGGNPPWLTCCSASMG